MRNLGKILGVLVFVLGFGFQGFTFQSLFEDKFDDFKGINNSQHWEKIRGSWIVEKGKYISNTSGIAMTTLKDKKLKNFAIEFEYKPIDISNLKDNWGGIQIGKEYAGDSAVKNGYLIFIAKDSNGRWKVQLYKGFQQIAHSRLSSVNVARIITVVAEQKNIKVYIDGQLKIDYNNASLQKGYISLVTYYTKGSFDNFKILPPDIVKLREKKSLLEKWSPVTKKGELSLSCDTTEIKSMKILNNGNESEGYWESPFFDIKFLGNYKIDIDYKVSNSQIKDKIALKLILFDIKKRKIEVKEWELEKGATHKEISFITHDYAAYAKIFLVLKSYTKGVACRFGLPCFQLISGNTINAWRTMREKRLGKKVWSANWIEAPGCKNMNNIMPYFRKSFNVSDSHKIQSAKLQITAEAEYELYINGKLIGCDNDWMDIEVYDISACLLNGDNVIGVKVSGGNKFLLEGYIDTGENVLPITTDTSWKVSLNKIGSLNAGWEKRNFDDTPWLNAQNIGKPPCKPWRYFTYGLPPLVTKKIELEDFQFPNILDPKRKDFTLTGILVNKGKFKNDKSFFIQLKKNNFIFSSLIFLPDKPSSKWKVDEKINIGPIKVPISCYLQEGKYDLLLGLGTELIAERKIDVLPREKKKIGFPSVEIKVLNGTPTPFIKDKPYYPIFYKVGGGGSMGTVGKNAYFIENMKKAGVHFYFLNIIDIGWKGAGKYDYKKIDAEICQLLSIDPEAYIFPRFFVDGRRTWGLRKIMEGVVPLDELCKDDTGSNLVAGSGREAHTPKNLYPSFASPTWRKACGKAVKKFIQHLKNSHFADRIAGFVPTLGTTGDTFHYGSPIEQFVGYSKASEKAFQEWCKKKYLGIDKLNKAWSVDYQEFENILVPTKEDRLKTDLCSFRDPQVSQRVIDFYQFWQELVVDTINYYAKLIKEETEGKCIVGAYYGYVLGEIDIPYFKANSGHFALYKALDSPYIDFLMAPNPYKPFRDVGMPNSYLTVVDSFKLHNKFFVSDIDNRTLWSPQRERKGYGVNKLKDSIVIWQRDMVAAITKGIGIGLLDFGKGWLAGDPRLTKAIGKLVLIAKKSLNWDKRLKGNGFAVIVDDTYVPYESVDKPLMSTGWNWNKGKFVSPMRLYLNRSGVPHDYYLLHDLTNPKMPKYKCYLFLNCFKMNEKQRRFIKNELKKDGKILVFIYAPGFISDNKLSIKLVSDLTSINLDKEDVADKMILEVTDNEFFLVKGLGGTKFGADNGKWGPLFYVNDVKTEVLGKLVANGQPAFVVKKFPDWTSIYSAVPLLNSTILRNIAKLAGIHTYTDEPITNGAIYIGNELVGYHTLNKKEEKIRLPDKSEVFDLLRNEAVKDDDDSFLIKAPPRSLKLYRIQKKKTIKGLYP